MKCHEMLSAYIDNNNNHNHIVVFTNDTLEWIAVFTVHIILHGYKFVSIRSLDSSSKHSKSANRLIRCGHGIRAACTRVLNSLYILIE